MIEVALNKAKQNPAYRFAAVITPCCKARGFFIYIRLFLINFTTLQTFNHLKPL